MTYWNKAAAGLDYWSFSTKCVNMMMEEVWSPSEVASAFKLLQKYNVYPWLKLLPQQHEGSSSAHLYNTLTHPLWCIIRKKTLWSVFIQEPWWDLATSTAEHFFSQTSSVMMWLWTLSPLSAWRSWVSLVQVRAVKADSFGHFAKLCQNPNSQWEKSHRSGLVSCCQRSGDI